MGILGCEFLGSTPHNISLLNGLFDIIGQRNPVKFFSCKKNYIFIH